MENTTDGNFRYTEYGNNFTRPDEDPTYVFIRRMQTVIIPVICFVGIISNSLAVGAFFSKSLRATSCCLYLGAKSISDIGFLISLFVFFLFRVRVPFFINPGVCQITVFLTYICPFLSVWFVVIITFENFIRISQPALVATVCNQRTARIVIIVYILIVLAVYNFPFWTTGIVNGMCTPYMDFKEIIIALTYVDSFLTLVVPLVLMTILVPLVAVSALQAHKRKQRLNAGKQRKDRKATPEAQVTRLLFAVSVVIFVLHTPSHAIRIKKMIVDIYGGRPTVTVEIVHRIFEIFHYLDFCVSLGVYLLFGTNFRKVFKKMYFTRCTRKQSPKQVPNNEVNVSQRLLR